MKTAAIFGVTITVACILLLEWKNIKRKPNKDKLAFFSLLFIGWLLGMLDLENVYGPTSLIDFIYKPLVDLFLK